MKVIQKSEELEAIQYNGENTKEVIELIDSPSLGVSMSGGLLHLDTSGSIKHEKIQSGSWIVENKVHGFTIMSNTKFMLNYNKVV